MTRLTWKGSWCVLASSVVIFGASAAWGDEAVHGEGADPMTASSVQVEQAQARFARAKELYDNKDFEAALKEFQASRSIVASPNARLYQARCLRESGSLLEAYATFGRTMIEAMELAKMEARYGRTAEAARTEREELEAHLGFVKLNIHNATPTTTLTVNGEEIRRTAWTEPVVVLPGEVSVELATPGQPSESRNAAIAAGETQEFTLSVRPQQKAEPAPQAMPTPSPGSTQPIEPREQPTSLAPYAYTAVAVGAAGFGAFGFFGLSSKKKFDQLEAECGGAICPENQADTLDEGKREQLWANIGLAVGVAGAAAAVTLFILDPDDEDSVALVLSPTMLSVRGSL